MCSEKEHQSDIKKQRWHMQIGGGRGQKNNGRTKAARVLSSAFLFSFPISVYAEQWSGEPSAASTVVPRVAVGPHGDDGRRAEGGRRRYLRRNRARRAERAAGARAPHQSARPPPIRHSVQTKIRCRRIAAGRSLNHGRSAQTELSPGASSLGRPLALDAASAILGDCARRRSWCDR